jgi:N-methylhydantoinase A
MQWLGVDVGGTFTDLVLYDEATGRLAHAKTPSTPEDQSRGVIAGIDALGVEATKLGRLAHGSTVATNTLLERNGAKLAAVTTEGFRDVLVVGRGNRTTLYDIKARRPPALLARAAIHELAERMRHDGTILREPGELGGLIERLKADGAEAVAVCFLHSYANPASEAYVKAALQAALPGVFVTASHEVSPEYREYERFATTAVNAYVAPRVRRYLASLEGAVRARGYRRPVAIMTSNGGAWPIPELAELPVNSVLSGPAAGVIGAAALGRAAGEPNLITCDMGGTSTDCCLIRDGEYAMTTLAKVGSLPNRVRQIEINTVGAGGGSIAYLDAGGFLNVGPRSAGALPGPAAYGRGGSEPTVTDANLVLGRLAAGEVFGGEIRLDVEAARAAIGGLARKLGVELERMADGVVKLAVARMTSAIKEISIMRGHDPRDFALLPFGGAGPLHAALIADELGMRRVVVPPLPGNFSAFGLLLADERRDFVRARILRTADLTLGDLDAILAELREEGRAKLAESSFAEADMRFEASLDMRYVGQAFELSAPLPGKLSSMTEVETAFRRVYERRYTHATEEPTEIVAVRLAAYGRVPKPELRESSQGGAATPIGERPVWFDDRFHAAAVYERDGLGRGPVMEGPALIQEAGATTLVPPGSRARVGRVGELILERK